IRVRFAPSADGHLQVGDVRTALYGWASARHTGGTFVLRAEDIGASETDAQPVAALIETLHWLGLNWDEGPDQDGPYGPYRQSERIGLYHQWAQQFLDTGYAYWCYCTTAERQARHGAAPALEVRTAGVPAAQAPTTQVPAATGPAATQAPSGPSGPSSPSNSGDPTSPSGPPRPDDPPSLSGPDDYDRYCRTLEPDQV